MLSADRLIDAQVSTQLRKTLELVLTVGEKFERVEQKLQRCQKVNLKRNEACDQEYYGDPLIFNITEEARLQTPFDDLPWDTFTADVTELVGYLYECGIRPTAQRFETDAKSLAEKATAFTLIEVDYCKSSADSIKAGAEKYVVKQFGALMAMLTEVESLLRLRDRIRDDVVQLTERMLVSKSPNHRETPDCSHSDDFRSVSWYGAGYSFTANQAPVIRMLWEHWERKTPDVGDETLLSAVDPDAPPSRLNVLFRDSPAWGTMIVEGATRGTHRLEALA